MPTLPGIFRPLSPLAWTSLAFGSATSIGYYLALTGDSDVPYLVAWALAPLAPLWSFGIYLASSPIVSLWDIPTSELSDPLSSVIYFGVPGAAHGAAYVVLIRLFQRRKSRQLAET